MIKIQSQQILISVLILIKLIINNKILNNKKKINNNHNNLILIHISVKMLILNQKQLHKTLLLICLERKIHNKNKTKKKLNYLIIKLQK